MTKPQYTCWQITSEIQNSGDELLNEMHEKGYDYMHQARVFDNEFCLVFKLRFGQLSLPEGKIKFSDGLPA